MPRVKRGFKGHHRHKKILKLAKGYYAARSKIFRVAVHTVQRALVYAFRDRRVRKRTFRGLWIQRLNAALRPEGLSYSRFIGGLRKSGIALDRKVLSDIAISDPTGFKAVVEEVRPFAN